MKNLKYILSAFVIVIALSLPIFLTGCTKHYTVSVSINGVGGSVVKVDSLTHIKKDLVGDNDVEEGSNFEYAVAPNNHYHIKSIIVDGEPINFSLDEYGIARPILTDIKANHTIVVEFEPNTYTISYYYKSGEDEEGNPLYTQFKVDNKVYYTSIEYKQTITIDGIKDFGLVWDNNGTLEKFPTSDTFTIHKNYQLYTDKTEAALKALLGLEVAE